MNRIHCKYKGIQFLCLFFLLFNLSACNNQMNQDIKKPLAHGYIWEASKDGKTITLVGTMHPAPTTHHLLNDTLIEVLNNTDTLSVEIDITTDETISKIQESYYLPPSESLADHLAVHELTKLTTIIQDFNPKIDLTAVKKLNAVGLENLLTSLLYTEAGFTGLTLDALLIREAKERDIQITELEGAEFQIALVDKITNWDTIVDTINTYSETAKQALLEEYQLIFDHYATGDIIEAEKLLDDMKTDTPELYTVLITERNITMSQQIDAYIIDDKNHTVAIGYRHFIGEDSILSLLATQGYTITRIGEYER